MATSRQYFKNVNHAVGTLARYTYCPLLGNLVRRLWEHSISAPRKLRLVLYTQEYSYKCPVRAHPGTPDNARCVTTSPITARSRTRDIAPRPDMYGSECELITVPQMMRETRCSDLIVPGKSIFYSRSFNFPLSAVIVLLSSTKKVKD